MEKEIPFEFNFMQEKEEELLDWSFVFTPYSMAEDFASMKELQGFDDVLYEIMEENCQLNWLHRQLNAELKKKFLLDSEYRRKDASR